MNDMSNELHNFIQKLMLAMHTYQKVHNTKSQCGTNSYYFCDSINYNFPEANAQAASVIAYSIKDHTAIIHIVVMIGNKLYDPSYETFSLKDVQYFHNVKDLKNWLNEKKITLLLTVNGIELNPLESLKFIIKEMIRLTNISKLINNGGSGIMCKKYYNKQADFIDENLVF